MLSQYATSTTRRLPKTLPALTVGRTACAKTALNILIGAPTCGQLSFVSSLETPTLSDLQCSVFGKFSLAALRALLIGFNTSLISFMMLDCTG
jgi:hypothetical protein